MAYPSIANYNTGGRSTNATSTTITPPAGTQAGDLLILFFTKDGSAAPTGNSGGFTVLTGSADSGNASYHQILYKKLTEAQSNFTVSHASECTGWVIVRIPGGDVPQFNTVARASSTAPNATSLTHSFGSGKEVLWITSAGWDYNRTVSGWPSTFTLNRYSGVSTSTAGAGTAIAALQSTTNPQDPGAFTISAADTWCAYTIAVVLELPTINITNTSRTRVSDETGCTTSTLTFQCSQAASQWEARATVSGQTPGQGVGLLVGSGSAISANTDVTFDVTYDELSSGDRDYRVDVYCQVEGVWY